VARHIDGMCLDLLAQVRAATLCVTMFFSAHLASVKAVASALFSAKWKAPRFWRHTIFAALPTVGQTTSSSWAGSAPAAI
ncbi:MAG: hypothetical protein QGG73_13910, partial [Candidatus Hydrogenedentes bacterium]|nr:hypothetical protein [Candidatus Hydrogenedentota bacterium]